MKAKFNSIADDYRDRFLSIPSFERYCALQRKGEKAKNLLLMQTLTDVTSLSNA